MIALFLFLLGAQASAGCNNLRIDQLDNVDFTTNLYPTETFRVRRSGNGGCNFFLTVDNGGAGSYTSRRLSHSDYMGFIPVQICADAACSVVLKHFPEATSAADVLAGSFPNGHNPQENYFSFRPRLGTADYQRYGRYEANFNMRLYEGTVTGSHSQEDIEDFRLRYDMSKRIDLSIVSTGAAFDPSSTSKTLNFGNLSTGQEMGFDLVLKYNAGYLVKMSSQNGGKLKHLSQNASVPYTLTLSGNPVSLSTIPSVVAWGIFVNPYGGLRLPGKVKIGTVGGAQAGVYQDSVTITVSTTE
jgi:hypothetical protein